jgi:hypothetical protein
VDWLRQAARGLSPADFARVMVTGIVSVDAQLFDMPRVAAVLFRLNIAAYLVIWGVDGASRGVVSTRIVARHG